METEKDKYIIVQGGNIQNAVNLKIQQGYKPIGGIAILHDSESGFWFSQAMILPEDDIEGFIENDICKACNFPEIVNEKGVCADCQGKYEKL